MLSSCVTDAGVWGASVGYSSPGFSTSVAWTNASYDVNGFPIYGYAYGRPVYGYTAAGAAIFSIAALTAWCYVPDWGPAPWYHGHHHHPHNCHRAPAPPKYTPGHHPGRRPDGGMHAPVHKNPASVMGKPMGHSGKPAYSSKPAKPNHGNNHNARPDNGRPNHNMVQQRPNNARPGNNAVQQRPNNARPGNNVVQQRPNNARPSNNAVQQRPGVTRPSVSRPSSVSRPANVSRPSSVSRPANVSRPSSVSRPANASRPSSVSRPANVSRPSAGGAGRSGGGRRR